ncbi:MAG: hypothetical protein ABS79_00190 [Planctomycetes bacterium SCN 63-9]|nr:MAG: hypothetical protein ABS79_00190 [Planctomycetes bacterium SCN 63-9]
MSNSLPSGTETNSRKNPTPMPAPRRRWRPVAPGCLKALAMLLQNPVTSSPVPRLHLAPVKTAGTLIVHDRTSGERFTIYTPKYDAQFRAGHRSGRWYARPVQSIGAKPISLGFATAKEAVDALRKGHWKLDEISVKPALKALRIIW